ncbi:MAG: hypothetical protein EKK39_02110 [Sphingobacteriales bacterium]|nr:MAG: hypothetical protein EKK39_02110 [Sphingobacteriales bacterium]
MKNLITTVLLSSISIFSFSQKKIAHKIYMYGNVENSIGQGKVAVVFEKGVRIERDIISKFKKEHLQVVSWQDLFLPGSTYTQAQTDSILKANNITSILIFTVTGKATTNYGSSLTNGSAYQSANTIYGSAYTNTQSAAVTSALSLRLQVYSAKNSFSNPLAVIDGEAEGSWGVASTTKGIADKIIDRMISGLKSEKAFTY